LPRHKKTKKKAEDYQLDGRQAVKAAFLLECLQRGINTPDGIAQAAEAVLVSKSAAGPMTTTVLKLLGLGTEGATRYGDVLGAAALGIPAAGGLALGYGAGKLHNAGERDDVESVHQESLLRAYQRMADDARVREQARKSPALRSGSIIPIA
jgi:hypothetical protein